VSNTAAFNSSAGEDSVMSYTTTINSADNLCQWVRDAVPGQVCLYHSGMLMSDRDHTRWETRPEAKRLHFLALLALRYQNDGLVYLVQRRRDDDSYDYIAMRSDKVAVALAA
jgi:hypothetical protein